MVSMKSVSTEHAILDIINQIENNMDNKMYSCGMFIDLKKAFDTVGHLILLQKLDHYGVRGVTNNWFATYLLGRQQTTQIGAKNISKKEVILSGVPQGSVLGPLLFLVYINDISNSSDQLKFFLFPDDTNLLYADKNLRELEIKVNTELSKIYDWLVANKLSLNIKKSNFVIFRPRQKILNYQVNLKVFDHHINSYISLERKKFIKYLGVLIHENLSWSYHIAHVASQISKSIGIISRIRHFVPLSTLHHIYRSLIQPYITYGIVAWCNTAKVHRTKLLTLQKRALRLMYFADYKSHAIPFFISSRLLPLDMLYFKSVAVMMHDVSNNLTPPNIFNLFTHQADIYPYETRSSQRGDYFLKRSRIDIQKRSFSRIGVKIWNSISCEVRQMSKCNFKNNVDDILLQRLLKYDDYIDVSIILANFDSLV